MQQSNTSLAAITIDLVMIVGYRNRENQPAETWKKCPPSNTHVTAVIGPVLTRGRNVSGNLWKSAALTKAGLTISAWA